MSVRILEGDCLTVMPTLDANSIDAVVTDPPYGLKFMGKEWDHGVPGVPFWEAASKAAKPGTYLLAFGGTRTHHRLMCAIEDAGWEIRDCLMWLHGQGFPKGKAQLKPAWEPIIVARKKGQLQPLNIDGCRIATTESTEREERTAFGRLHEGRDNRGGKAGTYGSNAGRWPANLVLDEEAGQLLDEQSGNRGSKLDAPVARASEERNPNGIYSSDTRARTITTFADAGGASRFFYCAKASRNERNMGIPNPEWNHHPTVKPLALMRWLVRLVTPTGGTVLDPFMGSGTTGVAAKAEGFRFIGIEKNPEYAAIARARIAEYAPLFGDVA